MERGGQRGDGSAGGSAEPNRSWSETAPAIARVKRALYLFLLPLLAAATLLTGFLGRAGSFDRLVLPIVSVVLLAMLFMVYGRWLPPRHIEKAIFGLFALVYLGKFSASLVPQGSLDQIYVWTPLLYVLAFLLFEPRPALRASVAVFVASAAVAAFRVVPAAASVRIVSEYYLATALLVSMVYGLSRLRRDVASLQTELSGMRLLAHQDVLTGLPNRRAMEGTLASAIALAERHAQGAAIILFDLDDFKRVNDQFGHDEGDQVLRGVARRGELALRRPDVLGRWGGEEFLVIAPGIDLPGAMRAAERLRSALRAEPFGEIGTVTASFGVTGYRPGDTSAALLKRADDALYLAKHSGKDRVEALTREQVHHVALPVLRHPFRLLERDTDALQRGTLAWLRRFQVAEPDTLYRWVTAVQPGWLAGHMHLTRDPASLQLASDWTFWMFLHDDHCDASAAGRQPDSLKRLHRRLLDVLAGRSPSFRDGALAGLLADLVRRLGTLTDRSTVERFTAATKGYFAATRWEAANRASLTTPDPETYERMRLQTSGLPIHTVLMQGLDGVPASDDALAVALHAAADRVVCWANDIYSLNKEVQEEDVHNLVLALQASQGLGLDAALVRAAHMHDEQVTRFLEARERIAALPELQRIPLEAIADALEARMAANLAWSERSSRYRAAVTVRVGSDPEPRPAWERT